MNSNEITSAAWSLTIGGVSGRVESYCLGKASIDDETDAEIGCDTLDASVVAKTMLGTSLTPTTGVGGKMLEGLELLYNY